MRALLAGLVLVMSQMPFVHAQSIAHGRALFESRCVACHSLDTNRVGPALRGVVGRVAGTAPAFLYSDAMAAATHTWDLEKIKAWLTDPEALVPGQMMNYRLDTPQDREDVAAYLESTSVLLGLPTAGIVK